MKLKPVDSISGITPKEFVKDYLKKGQPVIIKDFISKDSACWDKWSYDYFKEIAGQEQVDVYGREENSQNHAASPPVGKMTLAEYLDKISAEPTELRLFLFNLLKIRPELKKDVIYNDVTGGKVIQWLPYLFFGGEGSSTRNHFDIDMSHVFISQFQGSKRIWLFPNDQSDLLYKLPYNFHSIANPKYSTEAEYPGLQFIKGYEAVINPGDTLYMPAGWWHYIQYDTEGYSISVRALANTFSEKLIGARNLFITRYFDDAMRRIFKKKWLDYKIEMAIKRAQKAIKKLK
ncbi:MULTISPECIES: cupin-like domain-containing protein [Sphingobacterium]|uniref:Cupin-like domain-containing protein n=3 Tax=Sphingobacterium TaxID=28453 RepID=A0ABW5Z131_9SPHI|nr:MULTISPECIES: cupin-like domain-containing protein [Sphingobacterium]MBB2953973.1 ribosomal protein L16 Arg81 hydroxylase [Sphingobacterium sp. JUb56]MCS3553319.1 ribosomal protein L16 Arg81 hydroxylase [Sphingobacterium sp. JUb21]MCW2262387.1 ribosomal protein L16 Arg81 hydroxylase [Sphingobacterium kitahiroshimense]NJI74716.1 cupin-like domain-containing protein [Sphingobacterium sp. B16(2022)]QQD15668.1 cupin-like domain-containing protein [Sphingobacterium sp. UDSM-2020]